ncbi:hypothetical protein [Lewinella sp. LCG006]|uniref:hypothetical protein n=1 Tax=Lewinella sp. LCG006 TaxID=3231911 RepID=UPI00345F87AE
MDQIQEKIDSFKKSQKIIEEKRLLWKDGKKALINDVLRGIVSSYDFPWHVDKHETLTNRESIYLSMENFPSGIVNIEEKRSYMYIGGALHFGQLFSGKISVWIENPYVEEIAYCKESYVQIDLLEPSDVTESKIREYVVKFLDMMKPFEMESRALIGFKR